MIRVKDETFIINGEKKFIYGGELHYFRVPKKLWRDRIKKVKEAGCNLISTYIPWMWHEAEEGLIDLTGSTTEERDLKTFLKLVAEEDMYCLVRPGPYVMSEIRNHGIPYWVNEKYPEVIAKKQDGENHPTGTITYLHPAFLEKVDKWYKAVCEIIAPMQITKGGNVIMFQLDNEIGMLEWVTNQADYNCDVMKRFEYFLQCKYSEEELKNILHINSYEEAREKIKNPVQATAAAFQNEFMLFMRQYHREYIEYLKALAAKYGIDVPFVVNIHGFDAIDYAKRGITYPIGLSQLYEALKPEGVVAAGDYYIGNIVHENYHDIVLANAFTKAIQNEEQPLFSAEFQGGFQYGIPRLQPSTFDLTTRLCIANGMNSLNYYMFVGGENYEDIGLLGKRHDWQAPVGTDGKLRRHYKTIKHLAEVIKAIEKDLLNSKRDIVTHIGFYADYYMTEYSNEFTKEMYEELKTFRDKFLYNGMGKGLTLNNITYEGYDIKRDEFIDIDEISSLWMFSTKWMDESVQAKLVRYIEDGGKLVLFPAIPEMDMKGEPCTVLKDALEIKVKQTHKNGFVTICETDQVSADYIETYEGQAMKKIAFPEEGSDECCGFEKDMGKGKVLVVGAGVVLQQFFLDSLIRRLAEKIGDFPCTKRNDYIDVSFRSVPDKDTKFMFIQNYDEYRKNMSFDYFGEELFDGKEIWIQPRTGLILPLNYEIGNGVKIIYSTCEIVGRTANEIEVICKQNIERIKFTGKIQVDALDIDTEIHEQQGEYLLVIKNCQNAKVKIKF